MSSFLLLLLACDPIDPDAVDEVHLTGRVYDEPSDGAVIPGATVAVRDGNGEAWGETTAGDDGAFDLGVPANQPIFLELSSPEHLPTAFSGMVGSTDLVAEDGRLFARTAADLDAIKAEFGDCSSDEGSVVEGEVRIYVEAQDWRDLWLVDTAEVVAYTADGVSYDACYLDAEGVYDPSASVTGATGRFAIFGVPAGPVTLQLVYSYGTEVADPALNHMWLPEGGVAPYYPAYVILP